VDLGRLRALVNSLLDLTATFNQIANELLPQLNYNIFGIMLIDREGGTASTNCLALEDAEPIPERGPRSTFSLSGTVAEEVLVARTPKMVLVNDETIFRRHYPGSVPSNATVEFHSSFSVPVFNGVHNRGTVFAQLRKVNAFGPEDVKLVSEIVGARFK
jgi:hypothetical protein